MDKDSLKLVVDRKTKPKRTYSGEPTMCPMCGRNEWARHHSLHYKHGKHTASARPTSATCVCGHRITIF